MPLIARKEEENPLVFLKNKQIFIQCLLRKLANDVYTAQGFQLYLLEQCQKVV
jgi:hypothetical protein